MTAKDTVFNHTSNFRMSFSLGSICRQHRAVSAGPSLPSASLPEVAARTQVCFTVCGTQPKCGGRLWPNVSRVTWESLAGSAESQHSRSQNLQAPSPHSPWQLVADHSPVMHFLQPSTHHGSSGHSMNKPTNTWLPSPCGISSV